METDLNSDPAFHSLITADGIQFALPFLALVLLALGIWGLIRHEKRKHAGLLPKRGMAPGDGDVMLGVRETSPFGEGLEDATRVYRVSRDPKVHAQAMMPAKARKKDH